MNNSQLVLSPVELDARTRAAAFLHESQVQAEQKAQDQAQKDASGFQSMLWLRNFEHNQALEMQREKHSHSLELKKLELDEQARLKGVELAAQRPPSFWRSDVFKAVLIVGIPLVVTPVMKALCRPWPAPNPQPQKAQKLCARCARCGRRLKPRTRSRHAKSRTLRVLPWLYLRKGSKKWKK